MLTAWAENHVAWRETRTRGQRVLLPESLCVPKTRFGSQSDLGGGLSDRELMHRLGRHRAR